MKKKDVFKCTTPNGVEVTAAVVDCTCSSDYRECYLCYAQNRLFNYTIYHDFDWETGQPMTDEVYEGVVCEYCIIPELDTLLYGDSEEGSEDDEDLPIEYPHYDDKLEALESLKKYLLNNYD